MSVQNSTQAQEILEVEQLIPILVATNTFLYGITTITVLLIYDFFLCLDQEVEFIWRKRISLTSVLYLCTRYSPLLYVSLEFIDSFLEEYLTVNINTLDLALTIIGNIFQTLNLISLQGLLGIRLYAIQGGSKYILWILLFLYVIGVGTDIALLTVKAPALTQVAPLYFRAIVLTQSTSVIAVDTFVFLGTAYKTYGLWKLQREIGFRDRSIVDIIIRQGVFRYSVVVIFTIAIVIWRQAFSFTGITQVLSLIQQALSPLIVCRLTLELRERYETKIDEIALPTITWTMDGVRQGARYVHDTIIAEAAGEFGSYDD